MSNTDVAAVLDQIADLLDIAGENTFKVRSFRRASETVNGLGENIADRAAAGTLRDLPGIGESLEEVITELVETGDTAHRRELLERVPAGLLQMLRISGFGPRKAGAVWQQLGLRTVDELQQAAREGRLRELPGFGAKTETKILDGIRQLQAGAERSLLGAARPLAEAFVERIAGQPGVLACEMGGSTRRWRETVGDLDLLATSHDPAAVCRWFAAEGGLAEVLAAGETKVSGRMASGLQVDLRVVPPDSYGAALQYFTGSQQHNIRLRERAQKRGLTLNEYGIFEGQAADKGSQVAGATEEGVYAALELPWIPPELREDRGELEAAEQGRLPELLELGDLRCDLHLHTNASDGRLTLEQLVAEVQARGYSHMAVTNHSEALYIANGLDEARLAEQIQAIEHLNQQLEGFRVLAGTEADLLGEGRVDVPPKLREQLDIVIGSVHSGFRQDPQAMTERLIAALAGGQVDILGHPTGRLLLGRSGYPVDIEALIEAAVEYEVALEVNANPHRLDLSDVHCRLAIERGALLAINTDAHGAEDLDLMRYGVMTARRGWVPADRVINTWPLERLQEWLGRRRERWLK
jgi:DNA polymerase (family 10)